MQSSSNSFGIDESAQRYCAVIEYLGTNYCGWQSQRHSEPTLQSTVEKALSKIANQTVKVTCAGRTDKGVHAIGQVIHFDSTKNRSIKNWIDGGNHLLPCDVSIHSIQKVTPDFHARFDAYQRHYTYFVINQARPSALYTDRAYHVSDPLNVRAMQQASQVLVGTHDFSSFRTSRCQAKSPLKTLHHLNIEQCDSSLLFHFSADAFLYHMVRNICGCLLSIGQKNHSPEWLKDILEAKDRRLVPPMLPAQGLYLTQIKYPTKFNINLPSSLTKISMYN